MPDVDIDRILVISEKISNILSSLLSVLLIVQMFGDLLGINIFETMRLVISRPWYIPVEWIEMYYPLWYSMEWILLILMLSDQIFTMRYMQFNKTLPPPAYERWISLAMFFISFWLAMLFRYMTFTLIAIFSAISFSYTMFIKKE